MSRKSSALMPTATEDDLDSHPPLDPAIRVTDLKYQYEDGTLALNDLNMLVGRGQKIGIVGPSGCGKSTLLSVIASLVQPTSGRVDKHPPAPGRHPISMVFQKDTLLPWLTTEQNVALGSRFKRGRPSPDENQRVAELISLAGLEGFEKHFPYQLSGGMRRRVAFLAGVAVSPEILLLDEPFSALDEPTRLGIHQDAFEILQRIGATMVLVTHDLAEAISLCDEVLVLSKRPAAVYRRFEVPFGPQRSMLEMRQRQDFLQLYGALWETLSTQMKPIGGAS